MATQPEDHDDDELELTPDMEVDDEQEPSKQPEDEEEDGETVIGFEDDEPDPDAKPDSSVIRRMRQELRERDKRIAELQRAKAEPEIEVGPKPTLADCEYDEDKFDAEYEAWKERGRKAEQQKQQRQEVDKATQDAWQADLGRYGEEKVKLAMPDFDDAENVVTAALDLTQQAVIVKAADKPARFLYALSKSDAKLAELASIKDPIKMAAAVARMEGAVKEMRRKSPEPDRPERGSAPVVSGTNEQQLERLQKQADKTGDRSKLVAFKKEKGLI